MKNLKEIEDVIAKAIKKVGVRKENDLCRYIPMPTGGYMHHFTLRKMKKKQPAELGSIIEKHIIQAASPGKVPPKQRAPRGSGKRRDNLLLSKPQLDRVLNLARLTGDKELLSILSPKRSLPACKRDLIASIRAQRVDPELWNAYVEAVTAQQALVSTYEVGGRN